MKMLNHQPNNIFKYLLIWGSESTWRTDTPDLWDSTEWFVNFIYLFIIIKHQVSYLLVIVRNILHWMLNLKISLSSSLNPLHSLANTLSLAKVSPPGWIPLEQLFSLLQNICWCFHPSNIASVFNFLPTWKPPEGNPPVWAPCLIWLLGPGQGEGEQHQGDQDLKLKSIKTFEAIGLFEIWKMCIGQIIDQNYHLAFYLRVNRIGKIS